MYTLLKKPESTDFHIWKVMHEIIVDDEKTHVDQCSHQDIFWGLKALCATLISCPMSIPESRVSKSL